MITNIEEINSNLILKKLKNNKWELQTEINYHFNYPPYADFKIHVPKGTVTDLASVPKIFWSVFPPHGNYAVASIIHDTLYRLKSFPRALADSWFRQLMKELEVPLVKRNIMYFAVRAFGWTRSKDWLNGKTPTFL